MIPCSIIPSGIITFYKCGGLKCHLSSIYIGGYYKWHLRVIGKNVISL